MVLIWDITHHIKPVTERSHIYPIEKASEADEPLLWNIYNNNNNNSQAFISAFKILNALTARSEKSQSFI